MMDFLVSSLHSCRLCAMAWISSKDVLVHSAMLSIQLFFGLPLLRLPSTVPCSTTLVRPSDLVTCPYHFSFRRFTVSQDTYSRTRILLLHFKTWAILFSSHCPSSLRKRSCYTCKHTLHTSCMHISTNIILTVIHKLHTFMHKPRILFSYIFISN